MRPLDREIQTDIYERKKDGEKSERQRTGRNGEGEREPLRSRMASRKLSLPLSLWAACSLSGLVFVFVCVHSSWPETCLSLCPNKDLQQRHPGKPICTCALVVSGKRLMVMYRWLWLVMRRHYGDRDGWLQFCHITASCCCWVTTLRFSAAL